MAFTLPRVRWARALIIALYVAAVLLFLQSVRQYYHRNTGFTELIDFGDQFHQTALPAIRDVPHYVDPRSPGYDGQWYAQLALEPLLRNRGLDLALDTPQYRARRILFSWTAYLRRPRPADAGSSRSTRPRTSSPGCCSRGSCCGGFRRPAPRHFAAWFGCLYRHRHGRVVPLRAARGPRHGDCRPGGLGDGAAVVPGWRPACSAPPGSAGRPTCWPARCSSTAFRATGARGPRSAARGLVVVVPFVLWLLYIRSVYPAANVSNPDSFGWPFSGYLQKWSATLSELYVDGWGTFARFNFAAMMGLTVQIGYLLWRREWGSAWWRVGAAYCVLMPFLSYPVWEGYPGAVPARASCPCRSPSTSSSCGAAGSGRS